MSLKDPESEEEWYEEIYDSHFIKEIVNPLKNKKFELFLEWLTLCFLKESKERGDVLVNGQISDWHAPISDVNEVKEMVTSLLKIDGKLGPLRTIAYNLKKYARDDKDVPIQVHFTKAWEIWKNPEFIKMFNFLQLIPPKPGEFLLTPYKVKSSKLPYWSMKSTWSSNVVASKIQFIESILDGDMNKATKWVKHKSDEKENIPLLAMNALWNEDFKPLMKEPAVTDLFYFLNLIPPKEPQYFWGISSKDITIESLRAKVSFIENVIVRDYPVELLGDEQDISLVGNVRKRQKLNNIVKCKSCKYQFKCLLQHIRRSENCQVQYSESDINDLRDAAKLMTRVAKREWEGKNIDKRKAKWTKNNIDNKAHKSVQNAEYYRKNKEKIAKRKSEYYQKNKEEISKKVASSYQKNKESILKKRKEDYQPVEKSHR